VSFSKELKRLKAKEFLEPTKKFLEEKYKNYFKSKFWKEGKGYRTFCPCPSHNDTEASFVLCCKSYDGKPAEVRMSCFGNCGFPKRNFDIFDIVMWLDHCNLPQAYAKVKSFMDKFDVKLHQPVKNKKESINKSLIYRVYRKAALYYHHILLTSPCKEVDTARNYLKKRGVGLREVKRYMLGYAPKLGSEVKGLSWYFRKDFVNNWYIYEKTGLFTYLGKKRLKTYINKEYFTEGPAAYYGDFLSGRITIPIIDEKGCVVGLQGRKFGKCKKEKRYLLTKGCPKGKVLFGFYQNYDYFKKHEMYEINGEYVRIYWWHEIYVVEGAFDVVCADSFFNPIPGGCPFVATLGGPLTSYQVNILARHIESLQWPRIILFFDGGGEKFIKQSYDTLKKNPVTKELLIGFKLLPKGCDPANYYTGSNNCVKLKLNEKLYPLYTRELPVKGFEGLLQLVINEGKFSKVAPYHVDKEKLILLLGKNKKSLSRYAVKNYLKKIVNFITENEPDPGVKTVDIPTSFVAPETLKLAGGALILLLDLWTQQRQKKRALRVSVKNEMKRLKISKRTYFKYQKILITLGFIKKEKNKIKVRYDPKKLNIKFKDLKNKRYKDPILNLSYYMSPKGTNLKALNLKNKDL